jgi:hypothetical protein
MYVVGLLADLEASLRATSAATSTGTYGTTTAARAANIKQRLWQVQRVINNPQLAAALAPLAKLELRIGNSQAMTAAADAVGAAANEFATTVDGTMIAAIDQFLPAPTQYRAIR